MTTIPIEQILQDFVIIMIVASVMTFIFYKLRQPLVIGYIVAGIVIGPYSPPLSLVKNIDILNLFCRAGRDIAVIHSWNGVSNTKAKKCRKKKP